MKTAQSATRQSDAPFLCRDSSGLECAKCPKRVLSGSFFISFGGMVAKAGVGIICGSQALVADAMHSLADTVSFGINYAGAASGASKNKPAYVQSVLIGAIILLMGIWIFADNVAILIKGTAAHPGLFGLIVAGASLLVNWHLYRLTGCASRKFNDPNLFICNVQNRSNFFAACLTLAGVLLAELGLVFFDPLCAIIIGYLLFNGAAEIFKEAFAQTPTSPLLSKQYVLLFVGILACGIIGFFVYDIQSTIGRREVVLIPARGPLVTSQVDRVLGRARYFVIIDTAGRTMLPIENKSRYLQGDVSDSVIAIIRDNKVNVVLAENIGVEMFADLEAAHVRMYYIDRRGTVETILSDYKRGSLPIARAPNVQKGYGKVRWLAPW